MLHAFIDESESGANYFFLGALIVREENLAKLNQALDKIMVEFSSTTSVQPEAELHGYDMMQQKGDWNGIPLRLATAVFTQAMKAIDAYADAFYGEGIDRVKQAERYRVLYHHRTRRPQRVHPIQKQGNLRLQKLKTRQNQRDGFL